MERIYKVCCGVDVHKKLMVACVARGAEREVREFGATTRQPAALADWLAAEGCEMVAMESTGSYREPPCNVPGSYGLPAMVADAQHCKAVPGRKTDADDAEWLADLVQHGLPGASFVPDRAQRELRELLGYRRSLAEDRAREADRLQKMPGGANIKLSGTVSDIMGMSGRALVEAAISQVDLDEGEIARMRGEGAIAANLRASDARLAEDLEGVLSDAQRGVLRVVPGRIDQLEAHIGRMDAEIERHMDGGQKGAAEAISEIPGLGPASSKAVVGVVGTDMSRFPTAAHLCSWAGLCPGSNESAGKRKSGRTRKGNPLLKATLVNAAHSAVRNKGSYFHAKFQRIRARRGAKRAYVAVARAILTAVWHILADGAAYRDLGASYYDGFDAERKAAACKRKLERLGYGVVLSPPPGTLPA